MRTISNDKKASILEFINLFFDEHGASPTVREIASGTNLPTTTVHRYLKLMSDNGEMEYSSARRGSATKRVLMEGDHCAMPVLGYVSCGPGEEEEEQVIEYIRMPQSLIGNGDFFALIAKGESMIDAGIYPGDCVIVRRQNTASNGDIVVALYDGLNNLKELVSEKGGYILRSCNEDKEKYADIHVKSLQIQGVAVGSYHSF